MNLLVAGPDSLGEVVASTAVVRCLRRQRPELVLHYWVHPQYADALAYNPYIDKLYATGDDPGLLPNTVFDYVVDLRGSRALRQWAKAVGARYLSPSSSFLVSFLSEHFNWYQDGDRNLAEQYFSAVKQLGVFPDKNGLNYFIAVADEVTSTDIPLSHSAGYIALVVGEPGYDQPVPLPLVQAFCRQLVYPILLVNTSGNSPEADALAKTDPVKMYNACGKFSLNETADLIRRSRLVISGENGLLQVAAAFQKPLLVWRSETQASPFFPPYYAAGGTRQGMPVPAAGWVWPATTLAMLRKAQQGQLNKKEQLWVQQGLKLVEDFLRTPPVAGL